MRLVKLGSLVAPMAHREQRRRWARMSADAKTAAISRARAELEATIPAGSRRSCELVFREWGEDATEKGHSGTLIRGGHTMAARTGFSRRRLQHAFDVLGSGSPQDRRRSRPPNPGLGILIIETRRGGIARMRYNQEAGRYVIAAMAANEFRLHPRFLVEAVPELAEAARPRSEPPPPNLPGGMRPRMPLPPRPPSGTQAEQDWLRARYLAACEAKATRDRAGP